MFMLYAACLIALCNSLFLLSMEQPSGPLVAYNQTLLSLRNLMNPDRPPVTIELDPLNKYKQHEQQKSLCNSLVLTNIELNALNNPKKHEQQEPLCNSLVLTNNDHMHNLYKKVGLFLACKSPHYQNLMQCIYDCNYAKRYYIDEDHMGAFAFNHDNGNQKTSLFFYCLKHYNQKAAALREIPPAIWSPLAERLGIAPIGSSLRILIRDTNALLFNKIPHYHELVSCIHSNQKFAQLQLGDSSIVIDEDWQKKFVYNAFAVLNLEEPHNALRDIVAFVTKVKDLNKINEISDVGYLVLSNETTELDVIKSKKGQIALLCTCIERYNKVRGKKITPSARLYNIYKAIEPLHIIFPDAFDKDLLNAEKIAFAEYTELLDDIGEIKEAYEHAVEYCVKEQYPSQLSLAL